MSKTHTQPYRLHDGSMEQRGPSSYDRQNPDRVFAALGLKKGDVFLDIGCGQGDYCLAGAKIVGRRGQVYAVDKWPGLTAGLQQEADRRRFDNLKAITADIAAGLPLPDNRVDLCLLGTILHATTLDILEQGLGTEINRVLKKNGRVAVLEGKKEEQPFGPTLERRLAPEQVKAAFLPHGFEEETYVDLGHNYLLIFTAGNRKS